MHVYAKLRARVRVLYESSLRVGIRAIHCLSMLSSRHAPGIYDAPVHKEVCALSMPRVLVHVKLSLHRLSTAPKKF